MLFVTIALSVEETVDLHGRIGGEVDWMFGDLVVKNRMWHEKTTKYAYVTHEGPTTVVYNLN